MQTKLLLVLSLNDDAGRQDEWMSREGDTELLLYVVLTIVAGGSGDECLSLGDNAITARHPLCNGGEIAARVGIESRTGHAGEGARRSGRNSVQNIPRHSADVITAILHDDEVSLDRCQAVRVVIEVLSARRRK